MADSYAANLEHLQDLLRGRRIGDPLLAELVSAGLRGAGRPLRLSPQRTVLRLESGGRAWVLKLCHPRRPLAALRARLAPPAAMREWRNLQALGALLPALAPQEARAEQLGPRLGVLARPWIEGEPVSGSLAQEPARVGTGLAALHALGWCDPDLLAEDLIFRGEALLPIDLGQARLVPGGAPPLARRAGLLRLLGGLPPEAARRCGPELLEAHEAALASLRQPASPAPEPVSRGSLAKTESGELLAEIARFRRVALKRQSRRCLRENRDFEADAHGSSRREGSHRTPRAERGAAAASPGNPAELLAQSRRGRVEREGEVVRKEYERPGAAGWLRRLVRAHPARRGFRLLYLLELHGVLAALPLSWRRGGTRETLQTRFVPGRPAEPADAPRVAAWLGRLHAAGLGLRDPKLRNFMIDEEGRACLVDPDGLLHSCGAATRARHLGRLLAELPAGDPGLSAVARAYEEHCGLEPTARLAETAARHADGYRTVLARTGRN